MPPYSELPLSELNLRVTQLNSLLRQPIRCSPLEVDLELHQLELEIQNRELKDAVAALEISRAEYAQLFDSAPFGYMLLDRHGIVVDINLPGATLLQRDRRQIVGNPFPNLYLEFEIGRFH